MPVKKPEEISSHPPTVNLGLKRNKIATACSGFKKKKKVRSFVFLLTNNFKIHQTSGVQIKQHFHSCECGNVYEVFFFYPLKLADKIQTDGFQMLTSAFSLTSLFFSPWLSRSHHWRWEWNRSGVCAAQTQTGSKEGIMSHLRCRPLVWKHALLR